MFRYENFEKYGMELLKFDRLNKYFDLIHAFTTRKGGVSVGQCSTLNLSFNRDNKKENVLENFLRVADILHVDYNSIVAAQQVHNNKVGVVTSIHKGTGVSKECFFKGYDALITNVPGIPLSTLHGDCVPIYFWDNQNKAVGIAHSGWKGTVLKISAVVVEAMKKEYGTQPEKLQVVVGPSITRKYFKVMEDVYNEFKSILPELDDDAAIKVDGQVKWMISLPDIVKATLLESGIKEENLDVTYICTYSDKERFYSHRRDKGQTGGMAAIVCIKN